MIKLFVLIYIQIAVPIRFHTKSVLSLNFKLCSLNDLLKIHIDCAIMQSQIQLKHPIKYQNLIIGEYT